MTKKARLTVEIDVDLHRQLKALAAERGTTMRELCIVAFERSLRVEKSSPYLTAVSDPLLAELWDNEEDAVYDDL